MDDKVVGLIIDCDYDDELVWLSESDEWFDSDDVYDVMVVFLDEMLLVLDIDVEVGSFGSQWVCLGWNDFFWIFLSQFFIFVSWIWSVLHFSCSFLLKYFYFFMQ